MSRPEERRPDIVRASDDPKEGMPTKDENPITMKGFLLFLLGLWILFGSVIGMVAICRVIF